MVQQQSTLCASGYPPSWRGWLSSGRNEIHWQAWAVCCSFVRNNTNIEPVIWLIIVRRRHPENIWTKTQDYVTAKRLFFECNFSLASCLEMITLLKLQLALVRAVVFLFKQIRRLVPPFPSLTFHQNRPAKSKRRHLVWTKGWIEERISDNPNDE